MKRVLIVQEFVPHYRVGFFEKLREALLEQGVELQVAYGRQPQSGVYGYLKARGGLPFGRRTRNFQLLGGRLLFQPVLREALGADLVVVEQANRHLLNYLFLLLSRLRLKRVAFWGHGWNRQQRNPRGPSARIKAWLLRYPDWWFAYTRSVAEFLESHGVEPGTITVVQNSVDVAAFQALLSSIGEEELERARAELAMKAGAIAGLYCGRLYRGKKLPLLLRAAAEVRRRVPEFHLIIIGEGPERARVEAWAQRQEGVHCVGAKVGREKALLFKLAQVFLNPGIVGLAILDAFAGGLPVITTSVPIHSPEIDYLENGRNGLICRPTVADYTDAVVAVLRDRALQARLSAGSRASSQEHSLEGMVRNFQQGILQCLSRS